MNKGYCFYCMNRLDTHTQICPQCGRSSQNITTPNYHLLPGTILRNKYLLGTALGEGGFGITYIGLDTVLNMRVAIKEYFPHGYSSRNNNVSAEVNITHSDNLEFFRKSMNGFLREARALAKFYDEPGIVGVRDFFEENGTAYIVMEYLEGITLKKYIQTNGCIPFDSLIEMLKPIMLALEKIHAQNLIHRDISPDNIMMLPNGQLKLLDFGAARELDSEKSLSVMLKPGYAPEEQYRSKGVQGPWTDVYALSATIYRCLTGVVPDESLQRMVDDKLKTPSELGVILTPRQERILMKGLMVKSSDRFQSVTELRNALEGIGKPDVSHKKKKLLLALIAAASVICLATTALLLKTDNSPQTLQNNASEPMQTAEETQLESVASEDDIPNSTEAMEQDQRTSEVLPNQGQTVIGQDQMQPTQTDPTVGTYGYKQGDILSYYSYRTGMGYLLSPVTLQDGTVFYTVKLSEYFSQEEIPFTSTTLNFYNSSPELSYINLNCELKDCIGMMVPMQVTANSGDLSDYHWVFIVGSSGKYLAVNDFPYEDGTLVYAEAYFDSPLSISGFTVIPDTAITEQESYQLGVGLETIFLFREPDAVLSCLNALGA